MFNIYLRECLIAINGAMTYEVQFNYLPTYLSLAYFSLYANLVKKTSLKETRLDVKYRFVGMS